MWEDDMSLLITDIATKQDMAQLREDIRELKELIKSIGKPSKADLALIERKMDRLINSK